MSSWRSFICGPNLGLRHSQAPRSLNCDVFLTLRWRFTLLFQGGSCFSWRLRELSLLRILLFFRESGISLSVGAPNAKESRVSARDVRLSEDFCNRRSIESLLNLGGCADRLYHRLGD